MKKQTNRGITLISLVITIVILLILAGITIMSVTNNGIINKAEEGKFKTELAQLKEELEEYKVKKSLIGNFDGTSLSANKLWLYYDPVKYVDNGTIKDVMPSISKSMMDKIEVLNGEIIFSGSEVEVAWAKEIGINKIVKIENGVLLSDDDNLSILSEDGTFTVPSSVEVIGEGSFAQANVRKVIIPYTVKEIAQNAFNGNTTIEEVEFQTRTVDGELKGVTSIGLAAFQGCTALKKIKLPDTCTTISTSAFQTCSQLSDLVLPDADVSFGSYVFTGCRSLTYIEIPKNVTRLGVAMFGSCTNLEQVKLNEGLKSIGGQGPFEGCSALRELTLPSSVTSIGMYAFSRCSNLATISIGDNIKRIESGTFNSCFNLTSIKIGKSVNYIDSTAFSGCTKLNNITIDDENDNFSISNSHILLNKAGTQMIYILPSAITEGQNTFTIPSTVTSISGNLLSGFPQVTKVVIPEKVATIDTSFFPTSVTEIEVNKLNNVYADYENGLYKLNEIGTKTELIWYLGNEETVNIPEGLEIIKIGALSGDKVKNVKTVKTPNSLTTIEIDSIATTIQRIEIGTGVSNINARAFGNESKINIVIDEGNNHYAFDKGVLYEIDGNTKVKTKLVKALNLESSEFTVPDEVSSIGEYAFQYNFKLKTLNLNNVTTLDRYACGYSCITKVIFGNKLTELPDCAFYYAGELTEIEIPNGVTSIGSSCFHFCGKLQKVKIPSSVTSIGGSCFASSPKLKVEIDKPKDSIAGHPWGHVEGERGIQWQ